jgi:hypothetical protein
MGSRPKAPRPYTTPAEKVLMASVRKLSKVTPLSAAITEAEPDRELQRIIQFRFQKFGEIPTSKRFPTVDAIEAFYEHSFGIVGVPKPRPLSSLEASCDWRNR